MFVTFNLCQFCLIFQNALNTLFIVNIFIYVWIFTLKKKHSTCKFEHDLINKTSIIILKIDVSILHLTIVGLKKK